MGKHLTQPLDELARDIVADGVVDADEVVQLRERIYADGKVDKEEADFLFVVNDAVSGNENHLSWTTLFVDGVRDFLLTDEESPGEVDDSEADWLIAKLMGDEKLDSTELALLKDCLLYTSPSPRDATLSRMPSSA